MDISLRLRDPIAPQLVAVLNEQLGQGTVTRVVVVGPEAPLAEGVADVLRADDPRANTTSIPRIR